MKLVLLLLFGLFLVLQLTTTRGQQQVCRVVSICDGQQSTTDGQPTSLRGEIGRPGKRGPHGHRGPKGEKGSQGPPPDREELLALIKAAMKETADEFNRNLQILSDRVDQISSHLNQTSNNLSARVDQISSQLNQTSNKLDTLYLLQPKSCKTSEVEGRQFLASGDEVYCEGGWQVFQKRFNGSVSFNRDWSEYKNGFGDLSTEFWMGLDKLHRITAASTRCRLRVEIWDFSDGHAYAEYSDFSVGDEESFYRLTIGGYSGTAGDSITGSYNLSGMKFATRDRDNDEWSGGNCAVTYGGGGGWWYRYCSHSGLNNIWSRTSIGIDAMSWRMWKGRYGRIRASKMKVKCD